MWTITETTLSSIPAYVSTTCGKWLEGVMGGGGGGGAEETEGTVFTSFIAGQLALESSHRLMRMLIVNTAAS